MKVISAEVTISKKQDLSDLKIAQAQVGDETAVINARVVGGMHTFLILWFFVKFLVFWGVEN